MEFEASYKKLRAFNVHISNLPFQLFSFSAFQHFRCSLQFGVWCLLKCLTASEGLRAKRAAQVLENGNLLPDFSGEPSRQILHVIYGIEQDGVLKVLNVERGDLAD